MHGVTGPRILFGKGYDESQVRLNQPSLRAFIATPDAHGKLTLLHGAQLRILRDIFQIEAQHVGSLDCRLVSQVLHMLLSVLSDFAKTTCGGVTFTSA